MGGRPHPPVQVVHVWTEWNTAAEQHRLPSAGAEQLSHSARPGTVLLQLPIRSANSLWESVFRCTNFTLSLHFLLLSFAYSWVLLHGFRFCVS